MALMLNENWRIDADSLNWVLEKRRKKRNEDTYYWQPVGYYQRLAHACEAFFEKELRASTDSWDRTILAINKAVSDIRSLCADVQMTYGEYKNIEDAKQDEPVEPNDSEEDWGFLQ